MNPNKLKTFVGFKGSAATVQIPTGQGGAVITFMIIAANAKQLEILWNGLLGEAGPFDPARCKPAILIESRSLPDPKPAKSDPSDQNKTL